MARYRKIDVRLWIDDRFQRLSRIPPCGQGLWLYLLTNPETTNIPGLYRAGERALAEGLGWPLEAFREAFREAFSEGMVEACWKHRVVWIPKAIQYHVPESPNVVRGWRVAWDEIPDCGMKAKAYQSLGSFLEGLKEGYSEAFREALRQPSPNQEQEQEQKQEEEEESHGARAQPAPTRDPPSAPPAEALRLSDLLIDLVKPVPGARVPRGARDRWAREIAALPREVAELQANGNPWSAIEAGIRFAFSERNLGRQYEVVIRSGRALREKWPKLVAAARRAGPSREQHEEKLRDVYERYVGNHGQ